MNRKVKAYAAVSLAVCAFAAVAASACGGEQTVWGSDYETVEYKVKASGSERELTILNNLSSYIEQARTSLDQSYRKGIYASALDEVMKLAIELPVYQRKELFAYSKSAIVGGLLGEDKVTTYQSPLKEIWNVEVAAGHGALVMANETMDGVFNPFFYTAVPDGTVIENTQIALLDNDEYGSVVAGQNSLAYDYWYTMKDGAGNPVADSALAEATTYTFKIREGVKFSDGTELTMDDVLFNLYMYLDPAYSGSTTMYTLDIQGLSSYRTQMSEENYNKYYAVADEIYRAGKASADTQNGEEAAKFWEIFDEKGTEFASSIIAYCLDNYLSYAPYTGYTAEEIAQSEGLSAMFGMYMWGFGDIDADGRLGVRGEYVKDGEKDIFVIDESFPYWTMKKDDLPSAKDFWAALESAYGGDYEGLFETEAADTSRNFIDDAFSEFIEYLAEKNGSNAHIDSVSGIIADGDRLEITINGVDPAAIYRLSTTIAPAHYYGLDENNKNSYLTANGFIPEEDQLYSHGVAFDNPSFMAAVQQMTVPVGAGPYMAKTTSASASSTASGMYANNIVYLTANPHFTLAEITQANGVKTYANRPVTAKTQEIRYMEIASGNDLYNALKTGTVDVASPGASATVVADLEENAGLGYYLTDNLGYGYIGVNAKFVNELEARQAIMYAMDRTLILNYFTNGLAVNIERSMSMTSWAYPVGATAFYPYDSSGKTSFELLQSVGYKVRDPETGLWYNPDGPTLSLNFYIGGASAEDHPTSQTFINAAEILNGIGCNISVVYDTNLLSYIASGGVGVWAAAWSATIDPDMYQVYHKDTQATSALAWGYDYLLGKAAPQ